MAALSYIQHGRPVEMAGENDHPTVITHERDPVGMTYVSTGVHHDRLELCAPYDVDTDPTSVNELRGHGAPGHRIPDPESSLQ
ncbi:MULTISPECIES: hypothetical protein [Streptomyces]|uniref:hypothetical protein n=1 Tax=Streptomyces TaxID=1883 RepID=UPI001361B8A0|nr:hypothetical protein [Streptomyces sp. SID724]